MERVRVDRSLCAILALGILLRVAWAIAVPVDPVSDSNAYHVFASNLAQHGVYGWNPGHPDAYWPPGAPFVYSLGYRAFGVGGLAIVAINLALALAKLALIAHVVRGYFGARAAYAACAVVALAPTQIALTTVLSSEHLFDVALLTAVAAFERAFARDASARSALWAGVALAAASYVRPTALPLGIGLALIAAVRGAAISRCASFALVTCVAMGVLIAPWAMRNERVFGRVVLISANGGANLWMGNNADATGGYMQLPREVNGMDTAERDAYLGAAARRWMLDHPRDVLVLAGRKLVTTYERETIAIAWNARGLAGLDEQRLRALKLAFTAYWWAMLVASFFGIGVLLVARDWRGLLGNVPLALWAYFALVHAITVGQDRYHLPAVPWIAALAGLAVSTSWRPRAERLPPRE